MFKSLKQEGPQLMKGDMVIMIMMKKSWYENQVMEKIGGMGIMDISLLRLSEPGKEVKKTKS